MDAQSSTGNETGDSEGEQAYAQQAHQAFVDFLDQFRGVGSAQGSQVNAVNSFQGQFQNSDNQTSSYKAVFGVLPDGRVKNVFCTRVEESQEGEGDDQAQENDEQGQEGEDQEVEEEESDDQAEEGEDDQQAQEEGDDQAQEGDEQEGEGEGEDDQEQG